MGALIEELLIQMQTYLANANAETGIWDLIIDYIIPIISAIVLVGSALAGVIKYYREKNRDFNEKVLSGVYAPLFQYIVKQEYIRHLKPNDLPLEKYPIMGLSRTKEKICNGNYEKQEIKIMGNSELLAVKKDLNFGLVPQDLLVLLNVYEMALEVSAQVSDEEFYDIQFKLRENIIDGYMECRKKLGLDSKTDILVYKNNEFTFFEKS